MKIKIKKNSLIVIRAKKIELLKIIILFFCVQ